MYDEEIEIKSKELPDHLKKQVLDFIEFLSEKYMAHMQVQKKFKFDWEGGLSKLKNKTTAVELQHKALDWR